MQKKQQQKQGSGRNSSSSRTQEGSRARDADQESRGGRELSRAQSQPMRARDGMSGAQRGASKEQTVRDIEPEVESTGTPDEHYNLVSVLYHALQGAEIYEEYVEDAEAAGDDELAEFFNELQDEERRRADRAKSLLVSRISRKAA
jgi:hypothetical protein